jgi:hypothetical protein
MSYLATCIVIAIALAATLVVTISALIDLRKGKRFGETFVRWIRKVVSVLFTIP